MPEDIQGLIDKINKEGVFAAEEKARQIVQRAQQEAANILAKAKLESAESKRRAQEESLREQDKVNALLKQAGRDMLLAIRSQINSMLMRLIADDVRKAMDPDALSKVLVSLIKDISAGQSKGSTDEVMVLLNNDDCRAMGEGFLAKLRQETKKQVVLKPSEDIHAGFIISFDSGKSQFDFSDKALAEYISTFLKPKLKDLLQG